MFGLIIQLSDMDTFLLMVTLFPMLIFEPISHVACMLAVGDTCSKYCFFGKKKF